MYKKKDNLLETTNIIQDVIENIEPNTLDNEETEIVIPDAVKAENVTGDSNFTNAIEDSIVETSVEECGEQEIPKPTHKTVMIKATSRVATCLKDVWYSFEQTETRQILDDSDMESEREDLWNTVNSEVDKQVQDVISILKGPVS